MDNETTPDVRVGSRLSNNDPRCPEAQKVVTVTHIGRTTAGPSMVAYQAATRMAWIKASRIFTDGKKRAQGYNLLPSF